MKYLKSNNTTPKKVVLANTLYDRKNSQKNFAVSIDGQFRPPIARLSREVTRVSRDSGLQPGRTYGRGSGLSLGKPLHC